MIPKSRLAKLTYASKLCVFIDRSSTRLTATTVTPAENSGKETDVHQSPYVIEQWQYL